MHARRRSREVVPDVVQRPGTLGFSLRAGLSPGHLGRLQAFLSVQDVRCRVRSSAQDPGDRLVHDTVEPRVHGHIVRNHGQPTPVLLPQQRELHQEPADTPVLSGLEIAHEARHALLDGRLVRDIDHQER